MKYLRSYRKLFAAIAASLVFFMTPLSLSVGVVSVPDSISGGEKLVLQSELVVQSIEAQWQGGSGEPTWGSPARTETEETGTGSSFLPYTPCATTAGITADIGCFVFNSFASLYYVLVFVTTQIGVVIIGLMMDAVIFFSISSDFYRQSGIIEAGWEILRDLTNILFIFALLIIAFKMVLGQDDANNKRNLVKTILIALVVNFSLFMSYAIIDGSNILAHVFWNRIDADATKYSQAVHNQGNASVFDIATLFENLGFNKSPSLAIAGQINPQNIITHSGAKNLVTGMLVLTGTVALNILMIYVFFSVMLMFFGRILGLIILVVLSPLAFASLVVPGLQNVPYMGWKQWFPNLLKLSFMAPIFLFFLWLTVTFLGNEGVLALLRTNTSDTALLTIIINTYLFLGLIAGMLLLSKKVTKEVSGSFGSMASDVVQKAIGGTIAAGAIVATGGAAAAGLAARGAAATGIGGAKVSAGLNKFGKTAMSFKADPTKIPGFKQLVGKNNADMIGKATGQVNVSGKDIELGGRKTWDKFKDFTKGRGVQEAAFEYDKDVNEIKDNSGKWQEKITDAESARRIEDVRKDLMDQDSFEKGKKNKVLIQELRDAFSKGTVVRLDGKDPIQAVLPKEVTAALKATGITMEYVSKDGTIGGQAVSEVEFQEIVLKKMDQASKTVDQNIRSKSQEIKRKERELNTAVASGDQKAINTAEQDLRKVEDEKLQLENQKDTIQKEKEIYEQKSLKKGKEKADQIETSVTGMAREQVAEEIEPNDKKAADRIRSGKVKIDTKKDDEK